MSEFKHFTSASPCPVCGGWLHAGDSGDQCSGGLFEGRPRTVWCSVDTSGRPSKSGKTWRHALDQEFIWKPAAKQHSDSERPERESWPPGVPKDWERTHIFNYQRRYGAEIHTEFRVERFAQGSEKTFRPYCGGRYRQGPPLLYREPELEEAVLYAEQAVGPHAQELARKAGADQVEVQMSRTDRRAQVGGGWGEEIYLGTELLFTAMGRPSPARHGSSPA